MTAFYPFIVHPIRFLDELGDHSNGKMALTCLGLTGLSCTAGLVDSVSGLLISTFYWAVIAGMFAYGYSVAIDFIAQWMRLPGRSYIVTQRFLICGLPASLLIIGPTIGQFSVFLETLLILGIVGFVGRLLVQAISAVYGITTTRSLFLLVSPMVVLFLGGGFSLILVSVLSTLGF